MAILVAGTGRGLRFVFLAIATMNDSGVHPVVVVTGSSSGIGRAIVSQLAAGGFRVVAGLRRMDDAAELRQESELIMPVLLDVTDQDSIAAAVATVQKHFPAGIDGLVNNAGIAVAGPVELVPRDQWQRQFDVNFFGMVSVTQGFLPMLRQRRGRIINISSASSSLALPMIGPYASSKYAVEALSDSLRRELRESGVKVVIICPGQTATPIFAKSEQETQSSLEPSLQTGGHDYASGTDSLPGTDAPDVPTRADLLRSSCVGCRESVDGQAPEATLSRRMGCLRVRVHRSIRAGFACGLGHCQNASSSGSE